jgi:hypothetical protein
MQERGQAKPHSFQAGPKPIKNAEGFFNRRVFQPAGFSTGGFFNRRVFQPAGFSNGGFFKRTVRIGPIERMICP